MPYFFIANIKIIDSVEYQKYINEAEKVFKQYNGKYLAVEDTPLILEGSWDYTRTVVIQFDSQLEFKNWYHSRDYQKILKHRLEAAKCDTVLVKGL
jgi:uncharacterized protein (DUF1330 family)